MNIPLKIARMPVQEVLDGVAAKSPTPGGGAVAAVTAALAAALAQMVVNYSIGKKTLAAHDSLHQKALQSLNTHSQRALELADEDALAYARLNELGKLAENDERRRRDYPAALDAAIAAPQAMLELSMDVLRTLQQLVGTTNALLKSDLAVAAILAEAAVRAAAWNVRINLSLLNDAERRAGFDSVIERSVQQGQSITLEIERACRQ